MKIQILHDSVGNICGVFAPPPGKRKGQMFARSLGHTVTEVDVPEIAIEATRENQEKVVEALDRVVRNSKIVSGRLVRSEK
jgi:hypothetical protein